MEERLRSQSARMAIYKNPALLAQARRCIPVARLEAAARGGGTAAPAAGARASTKWLDFNTQPLVFELGAPPQPVDAWGFTTANDGPEPDRRHNRDRGANCA